MLEAFYGPVDASCRSRSRPSTTPQTIANGYIVEDCVTAEGTPFQLAAAPVQFGEDLPSTNRAPEFNEHGDEILEAIGLDWMQIIDLKVRGVVA